MINFSSFHLLYLVKNILLVLFTLLPVIMAVAFYTIFERKVMASVQRRKGPSNTGFLGILQPFSDGLKLLLKEISVPLNSNFFFFLLSPFFSFFLSLICWVVIPFNYDNFFINFNYSAFLIFVINSFGIYSIIFPGLSSYSKYTILGSFRAISQFISYELIISFIFLFIVLICSSLNFIDIVFYQQLYLYLCIPLFPIFIIFFISILAETNRSPFDLPEAESELVSGYSTEYSASVFTMFFLAEYSNMILWSFIVVIFFLGGWVFPFFNSIHNFFFYESHLYFLVTYDQYLFFFLDFNIINIFFLVFKNYIFINLSFFCKVLFVNFLFILVRSSFPRYRFDSLLYICWKGFLPFLIGYYMFIYSFLTLIYLV